MKKLLIVTTFVVFALQNAQAQYFQELYGSTNSSEFLTDGHNAYIGGGGNTGHFLIGTATVGAEQNRFNVQKTDINGSSLGGAPYYNNHYYQYDNTSTIPNSFLALSNPQSVELSDQSGYAVVSSIGGSNSGFGIGVAYCILDPNNGNPLPLGTKNSIIYYPSSGNYNNLRVVSLIESQKNPGYLIVCGYVTETATGDNKVFAFKIDQAGALQWNRIYNIAGSAIPHDIVESPYQNPTYSIDEFWIVGGIATGAAGTTARDAFILRVDDIFGNMFNPVDFYGTSTSDDVFTCITASGNTVIDANGEGFVIGGHTDQSSNYDVWSMGIANNKTVAWTETYNYRKNIPTHNNDFCNDIMERINSNSQSEYYLVGYTDRGVYGTEDVLVDKIDNNGNAVALGQFTYGDKDADRGIRVDQLNNFGTNVDGLAIYSYSWYLPPFQIGGFDHFLVKAYFNGVTACNYDLKDPDQHPGPNFIGDRNDDNVSDFTSYDAEVSLIDHYTESQICSADQDGNGDNARLAPDPGNNKGTIGQASETAPGNAINTIVPNPIAEDSKQFSVMYEAATAGNVNIKLMDATGRLIVAHTYTTTKGQNALPFDISSFQLASAIYYLNIESTTGVETIKLRVIK